MIGFGSTIWCDNCGVEILWGPIVVGRRYYCCRDCFDGARCKCSERIEMEDDRRGEESSIGATAGGVYS